MKKIYWITYTLGNAVKQISTMRAMTYEEAFEYAFSRKPGPLWSIAAIIDKPGDDWRRDRAY